jgi:hypothetical protein
MSLTDIILAPFTLLFRLTSPRPWLTITVSIAAGLGLGVLHHPSWMAVLIAYAGIMLMWLDESEQAPLPAAGAPPE